MSDKPPATKLTRLARWRAFFASTSFLRHPVSVTRERVGVTILAIMVAGFALYTFTTRDSAIRQRAIDFIRKSTPGGIEISVGRAGFKMFEGITLYDVKLAVPHDDRLDPRATDFASRTIFSACSLKLIHNPWLLLVGKLRVERVVAVQPSIYLRHNTETGIRNWQLLTVEKSERKDSKPTFRPIITLRDARAVVDSIDADGRHEQREEVLDADVRPHPQAETGYYIEVRRYTEPIERATVYFDPGEKMVANTPFVDARTIRLQLPRPARDIFDRISLRGEVRLSRLLYDSLSDENRDTEIILRHVQCDIPLRMLEKEAGSLAGDVNESLVRMEDVRGSVKIVGNTITMDAVGLVNKATCRLRGRLWNITADFPNFGVDVTFEAQAMPLPEGNVRKRMLGKESNIPGALREFLEDYEPHGRLDIFIHFARAENTGGNLRTDGRITTLDMTANTIWFPYPLDHVNGVVRFEGKDIYIENLHGRHGCGNVNINAHINVATKYSNVDLDIQGTSIPLDTHLYDALPARYQAVLDRFNPRGMAHIHARLHRPGGPADQPKPKWTPVLSIELLDARAAILPHPYPLENVHGRLEVDGDRTRIIGLSGESEGATMQFDGYAMIRDNRDTEMEVRVEADNIRLDEEYVRQMPRELGSELSRFNPRGRLDVLGTVSLREGSEQMKWSLGAKVRDATIRFAEFPYPLENLTGDLEIEEDRLTFSNITASHGDATLRASGEVRKPETGEGSIVELTFNADGVPLDQILADSLPPNLKHVWNLLKPRGRVRVRTDIHSEATHGQSRLSHRTEIELLDADILFTGFPLPLSNVSGKVLVDTGRVEILNITGRSGEASISLRGEIQFDPAGIHGALDITAESLQFDAPLVSALPTTLRKFVQSIQAQGRFDLHLTPLQFHIAADDSTAWYFDGALTLKNANADLGFKIQNCDGRIEGRGTINEAGILSLDSNLSAEKVTLASWHLTKLAARLHTADEGRFIKIDDAVADMYGGEAVGSAEIELGKRRSRYKASITAREMKLDRYVAVHHPRREPIQAGEEPQLARGDVSGNIILKGRTGQGGYSGADGEFFIREAQVWKLPIILAIFQVLNLTTDENVFHDGRVKFYLSKDQLTFQKIDLQGKAMSFVGGGTLDLATDHLDVTLLAGSPLRIDVPLLTELLEGVSREIMEVRLTGTLSKPQITPMPLKSFTNALKTLFPEPPPPPRD